jgi:hypothetical protein
MDKNTKILLGVGAVIAAYLILKPKKAIGQTDVVNNTSTEKLAQSIEKDTIFDIDYDVNTQAEYFCPENHNLYSSFFDSKGNYKGVGRVFCGDKNNGQEIDTPPVLNPNYGRLIIKKPLTPKNCNEAYSNTDLFILAYGTRTRPSGIEYHNPFGMPELTLEEIANQNRKSKAQSYALETIKSIGLQDCYNQWVIEQDYKESQRLPYQ